MSSAPPPPYYDPSKQQYQQAPPGHQPITVVQPVFIGAPITMVGDYPMQCGCPHCGKQIVSRTEKKNGLLTWLICGGLTLFGFWLCCCIPFCVDACKDTEHYCPNCNAMLGASKKL